MNVSPLMMPRRKPTSAPAVEVVYSTATGDSARREWNAAGTVAFDASDYVEAYCFVCGRCTDHVGEHDALVEAGLAYYTGDGSVMESKDWDPQQAAAISEAEYQRYLARLG